MYLRFPEGNSRLGLRSERVSDDDRQSQRGKHVSESVCMQRVEQLNSDLNSPGLFSPALKH